MKNEMCWDSFVPTIISRYYLTNNSPREVYTLFNSDKESKDIIALASKSKDSKRLLLERYITATNIAEKLAYGSILEILELGIKHSKIGEKRGN